MGQLLKQVSKLSGVYGQPGEERVSQLLAGQLPEQYVILNSPRLYYHGGTFDIDHIVIGPNGIFVIETKNMQGLITGGMMGNWVQERKRSGRNRKVKIGNPANQVNQYGKVVKSYLGSRLAYETGKKVNLKVYPIVVFVHDDADLSRMDYTRPGFIGRVRVLKFDELVEFIEKREGASYSPEEIEQFAGIIVPAEQRDQTAYFSLEQLRDYTEGGESRYEIFDELGRGSFGIVYRGFDYKLDQEVAVKKLPLQYQGSPNAVNRFYREAQIASALEHENIVGVYDYYEKAGEYYLVMELVEGQTLEEYVRECGRVPVKDSLRIIRDVCSALVYAHSKQVIHRDIKPSNILLTCDGDVKVSDFGIAKLIHSTDLTLDGTSAGTPATMSPEQITGGHVSEKSDIFAMGIVLYYLVTGQMPFHGEHIGEIIHQITHKDPVPPGQLNNEISPDLEYVILKALEKNPGDRFADAAEFLRAVEELSSSGHLSKKTGRKKWLRYVPTMLRPFFKSERKMFTAITVTSLLIFVGILGFQAYRDSRQLSNETILTKQYGFTNENIHLLYSDPRLYMGLPVNLVARVDKIVQINENNTRFSVIVRSNRQSLTRNLIISYNQPHFALQFTSYIKITGSVQNVMKTPENEQTPVVIADKVEPIEDPWSILAPAQYTIYPNKTVYQDDRVVQLEKVEFAEQETRLYVRSKNTGKTDDLVVLANPVGRQGSREYAELKNNYGWDFPSAILLQPNQESRGVFFLEPMDRRKNSAVFILGSSNDILMGQEPYVFEVKW